MTNNPSAQNSAQNSAQKDSDTATVTYREMEFAKDMPSVKRIWREIGWAESKPSEKAMDLVFPRGDTVVGCINDEAECSMLRQSGSMRLDQADLPLCVIAAVTTSRIGRGANFAQNLTAWQLARGAAAGASVAALGMFDQGFYNKLGFGTGAYINEFSIDPGSINVSGKPRSPTRLDASNAPSMLQAMLARPRNHGAVVIPDEQILRATCQMSDDGFGLGYFHDNTLSHFLWLSGKGEHGPYQVKMIGYQNAQQLLELLALLKSLADQIYSIWLMEPPEIQLQSMLTRPFRQQAIARKGKYSAEQNTYAWYQLRILDLPACVAAVHWQGSPVRFNLLLTDPVTDVLAAAPIEQPTWQGVGGSYLVEFAAKSTVSPQRRSEPATLPTLKCSVGAFSRLLWGVATASSLAISDDLQAPAELLATLNPVFKSTPHPAWEF